MGPSCAPCVSACGRMFSGLCPCPKSLMEGLWGMEGFQRHRRGGLVLLSFALMLIVLTACNTQPSAPPVSLTLTPETAIASGSGHACALRPDGSPVCWGENDLGQLSLPEGERFAAISSTHIHTCALRFDGSPVCWGGDRYSGASPPDGERLAAINSSIWHTCGLRLDGTPVCWSGDIDDPIVPPEEERFATGAASL